MYLHLLAWRVQRFFAQIVQVVGEVLPWLLPPWELQASCLLCTMWLRVVNLPADLAAQLSVGDALSAQIVRVVNEVVPWLLPPWELRARRARCEQCACAWARLCLLSQGLCHRPLNKAQKVTGS
jgi:hypothetical protein